MHVSIEAQAFLHENHELMSALQSVEKVARSYYECSHLSVDLHSDEGTCRPYLCMFIEPAGDFGEALERIGDFNNAWLQAVGEALRGSITFSLM